MQKTMIALGLVLGTLLTGCGVAPVFTAEAPAREKTIGQSTNGQKRQVLPMDKVQKGTYLGKDDPARHGLTKLKPAANPVGGAAPEGQATGDAVEMSQASAKAGDTLSTPGYLALEKSPTDMALVPILNDAGTLERLMFSPQDGNLRWEVSAKQGAVSVKKLRLTLQSTAEFPAPLIPELEASTATSAEGADSGLPSDDLVVRAGEPVTVDLETSTLNWPSALKSDMRTQLVFNLKTDSIRDFLASTFNTARVKLTLEFIDGEGNPVLDDQGKAFVLKQTIQVM